MQGKGYWQLPEDLETLHDEVIGHAVEIHHMATEKFKETSAGPLSQAALFALHWRAIVIHRSVRTLCQTGWTPTTPILIRTLLDIIASSYAVAAKPENAEYMGFKFLGSYLAQSLADADTSDSLREINRTQLEALRQGLRGEDIARADQFVKEYVPQPYWFRPEFHSPGAILKTAKNDLFFIYRQFSGSAHGGFLGSSLFDDSPDMADINPQEHPRRTRAAVVASSRILLDISYLRAQFEGVADEKRYKQILRDRVLPQKEKVIEM
jgi:uncharacterized protein DUF5677